MSRVGVALPTLLDAAEKAWAELAWIARDAPAIERGQSAGCWHLFEPGEITRIAAVAAELWTRIAEEKAKARRLG